MGVESRTHRGAAQSKLAKVRERGPYVRDAMFELRRPTRNLLPEREGSRVLEMGAADLYDATERRGFPREGVAQRGKRGYEPVVDALNGGDVHRRGKNVVGGLSAVDLVVGMDEALLAALSAEELARAVGQHFVHVHVGLRTGTRLPNHKRKLAVMLPREHLVRRRDDGICLVGGQFAKLAIDHRAGALDPCQRMDELEGHAFARNAEVFQRSLRLRAPQPVGRDANFSEAIAFDAGVSHGRSHRGELCYAKIRIRFRVRAPAMK